MFNKALCDLLEPGINALGFEVIAVELIGQGNSSVLRVYIDQPGGITVDECARVSAQVGAILDVEDPIPGSFTLEVSSPGFDRPLCKLDHFQAAMGQKIKLQTKAQISGRKRFAGTVAGVNDGFLTLEIEGEMLEVPMDNIAKARLVPDYSCDFNQLTN